MKILTICSNPCVSLEPLTQLLETAGLTRGLNSIESNQSYEQWHDQVFEAYEQDYSGLLMTQSLSPGKVWQDMASQLIYANLSKKQWYWTDSKAGWLLDFWHDLEPQHRFALIYTPPHLGIRQCLLQVDAQNSSIETAIKSWVNYHFELLRFYRSHQDKCILVNLERCLTSPDEFIQICKQHLGFDIDEQLVLNNESPLKKSSGIEALLFQRIVKQYPEINNLFQELEASATPFLQQADTSATIEVSSKEQLANICQDYRSLKIQQANDAKEKRQLQQTLETQLLSTQKLESDKAKENELILLQMHQLQEDLEAQFQGAKKLESDKAQEIATLQSMLKQVEDAKNLLENQKNEKEQENELILLQMHQLQEDLEAQFQGVKKLESDKAQEIATLQSMLKQVEDAKNLLENSKNEKEQENELMLLQLHQLQEELEIQFLSTKKLESDKAQEKQALQDQIQKIQQNNAKQKNENDLMLLNLVKAQKEAAELKKTQEVSVVLEKQKEQEKQALQVALKKTEEAKTALEKKTEQEKQTLQDQVKQIQQKNVELQQESELMLLHLQQAQKETEYYLLKYQELEACMQASSMVAFIEQGQNLPLDTQLIQAKQTIDGLDIDLINLQWQGQIWPKYHLQIINPNIVNKQTSSDAIIKLPLQSSNLLPLQTWPPQTADEQGAYWLIDAALLDNELTHSSFYPEDIAFLHALIDQLPDWLKSLEETTQVKNDRWADYYQVIDKLKPNLESIFMLQKS